MSLDLKQSLRLTQQLLMTPQLQQAIKLLQLSRLELEEFVASQIVENPVLEDVTPEPAPELANEKGEEREQEREPDAEPDFDFKALKNDAEGFLASPGMGRSNSSAYREDDVNYENLITKPKTLQDYLSSQVGEIQFDEKEREIALKIVGNITDDGYLDLDLVKMCEEDQVEMDLVEGVLDTIQRLDPPGVGARNLAECLAIQIREQGLRNGIVENIVAHHLKELETRNYPAIAKKLGITLEDVYTNVAIIVGLNPIPGRRFGENNAQIVVPDAFVFKLSGEWIVTLNEDNLPALRVSRYYQDISDGGIKGKERTYLQEKIKSANWLIKSIQQRQRTIRKVAECIVEKQVEFLENGIRCLKPMVLRDVAETVEMHESTISRVTSNKYIQTPRGVFELKFFFSSSVKSDDEEDVSSSFVKSLIKEIVAAENVKRPLSDQKIVKILGEKGVHLARRTVAKYREQVSILPSSKRKKLF